MDIKKDYLELAPLRKDLYGFFSRIYRKEITDELLTTMKHLGFPEPEEPNEFSEGVDELKAFLHKPGIDPRTALAVDYARVFLGAGIADSSAAYPYESVYTSPEGLMMQDARDEVVALYASKGLEREPDCVDPEDHIGFELDYMIYLISEGSVAAEAGDEKALVGLLIEQQSFLQTHLLNWVPSFCDDIAKYAKTTFYPAIASMTTGFLSMDDDLLQGLIDDGVQDVKATSILQNNE